MFIGGAEGFYDEINKGSEVKPEEKMFIGGAEGFYDDQTKYGIIMGFKDNYVENENNEFGDNILISNNTLEDNYEIQNNQYVF